MGRLREITGLIASLVTLLAMGVAVAQDTTWKDREFGARDPDRSIAACSKLLKRPSSRAHAAAFHHRGQAFAAKGKLDQAASNVSAGIRLDPQSAYSWQERAELYALQNEYQQDIADITEAIRRDPTPPRAFRFQSLAYAYLGLGHAHCIADYRLYFSDSVRFYARANALRNVGQYDRALADYARAMKLEPTNVWALGLASARMGRSKTIDQPGDLAA